MEPVLTALGVGLAVALIFSFCQYFSERRRRREFRNSWSGRPVSDPRGQSPTALTTAPALWNGVASGWLLRSARPGADTFPSFPRFFIHHVRHYIYAILAVVLMLVVRWLLEPVLEGSIPFSFFLAAVLFTAWTQGVWETLLALTLGFLMGTWFFAQPQNSLGLSGMHSWWAAILYFITGFGIVWLLKSEQTAWLRTLSGDLSALKRVRELQQARRPASDEAQGRREILASIVESAQDAIFSISPEGRITTWNASAEELLGWSAKEAIGQSLTVILPPTREEELQQITQQARRGERLKGWQTRLNRKGGDCIETIMTVSPIKEPSGRLLGLSLIVPNHPRSPLRTSTDGSLAGGQ